MNGGEVGLVADIGRHSVRFAMSGGDRGVAPRDVKTYHTAEHSTFTGALMAYLASVDMRDAALHSVLAVSGVARGDLITVTNGRWYISLGGVEAILRHRPQALNDFAANAFALTTLGSTAFSPLPGPPLQLPRAGGNYLVVGAGSGLGVAGLITTATGTPQVVQSEAGHMTLCATTPDEANFVARVQARAGFASAESLLSASGLAEAYAMMAGAAAITPRRPEDITRDVSRDASNIAAVRLFSGYLASFVGDMTMALGAWDGVFLTGPIARALRWHFSERSFRERMIAKGDYSRRLAEVPVAVVDEGQLELLGAAAALAAA